jgi:hypothetical protein
MATLQSRARAIRLRLLVLAVIVAASGLTLHAAVAAPTHGNRFEATFHETNASITNRVADLGVFQLINTGSGTVEGYGPATMVIGVTQDRSVQPCGPGSSTNAAVRRIVLAAGVLVVRELAHVCPTALGPVATGTWRVDGSSSTGVFAGARGRGDATVHVATGTATLTGKLKLAHEPTPEGLRALEEGSHK